MSYRGKKSYQHLRGMSVSWQEISLNKTSGVYIFRLLNDFGISPILKLNTPPIRMICTDCFVPIVGLLIKSFSRNSPAAALRPEIWFAHVLLFQKKMLPSGNNIAMENPPFEDVFLIGKGKSSLLH